MGSILIDVTSRRKLNPCRRVPTSKPSRQMQPRLGDDDDKSVILSMNNEPLRQNMIFTRPPELNVRARSNFYKLKRPCKLPDTYRVDMELKDTNPRLWSPDELDKFLTQKCPHFTWTKLRKLKLNGKEFLKMNKVTIAMRMEMDLTSTLKIFNLIKYLREVANVFEGKDLTNVKQPASPRQNFFSGTKWEPDDYSHTSDAKVRKFSRNEILTGGTLNRLSDRCEETNNTHCGGQFSLNDPRVRHGRVILSSQQQQISQTKEESSHQNSSRPTRIKKFRKDCFYCRVPGHLIANCPVMRLQRVPQKGRTLDLSYQDWEYDNQNTPPQTIECDSETLLETYETLIICEDMEESVTPIIKSDLITSQITSGEERVLPGTPFHCPGCRCHVEGL